jgi:hypothetical protein
MKKSFRNELTTVENEQLRDEIFVIVENAANPDEAFRIACNSREEAVASGDENGQLVATYKLVKVERLKLVKHTRMVKA